MLLDVVWAHFDVPDVLFEGGSSRKSVGIVGDNAVLVNYSGSQNCPNVWSFWIDRLGVE